jgi:hypothetical protein
MSKPIIRIHNLENNEIIDREMTDAEFAQYELDKANDQERIDAIIAKENAKSALLEKLGITEDEAKLLLG